MEISIVIPLFNESESLEELHNWILSSMSNYSKSFEIILIDDGSTDNSWQIIKNLSKKNKDTRGILFSKNFGKSQALNAGFKLAKGDYVITMDADLQDSPDKIYARGQYGPKDAITKQPLGGRARGGGLKIGTMDIYQ